jgi:CheY-like chemotaxis protein
VALVDDSRQVLDVLGMLFEELGFEVWPYEGGTAALRGLAAQAAPDAILLDVCMPGMDGWQVLGQLRGQPALAGVQVFMMSAADDPGGSQRAALEGADDYLVKPFSLGDVAERIAARRQSRLMGSDTHLM